MSDCNFKVGHRFYRCLNCGHGSMTTDGSEPEKCQCPPSASIPLYTTAVDRDRGIITLGTENPNGQETEAPEETDQAEGLLTRGVTEIDLASDDD